ncbi:MAG: flavin-containing monooxygenase [Actinomycetes bacterium]
MDRQQHETPRPRDPQARQEPGRDPADRGDPVAVDTVIIGGGQAGLAVGYHLTLRQRSFVILEAGDRVGDCWRRRWDSLRLFTPARFDALPGLAFPERAWAFPDKDAMADYLESYAAAHDMPVRTGVRVDGVTRAGDRFVVSAGPRCWEAANVVLACGAYQVPWVPDIASDLDPDVVQLHSYDYRNPAQLQEGPVLVVGAGNSGADVALDVAPRHQTWLSGRDVGHIPFRIGSRLGRLFLVRLVLRVLFHRVLTMRTPMGRKMRPIVLSQGGPLIRVRPKDLDAAGVERVPRVAGVRDGRPVLEDGRVLEVANVVWCTGFRHDFSWVAMPTGDGDSHDGGLAHRRGVVEAQPGLYAVGMHFQYAMSSAMIHGVGRDAEYLAEAIVARTPERGPSRPSLTREPAGRP